MRWFSLRLRRKDLPGWFTVQGTWPSTNYLQLGSACAALVAGGHCVGPNRVALWKKTAFLTVRQRCETLGLVCTSAKGLSLKQQLCSVLQSASMFCVQKRLQLVVSHIPGERNVWADQLSRGEDAYTLFYLRLWTGVCSLGRDGRSYGSLGSHRVCRWGRRLGDGCG